MILLQQMIVLFIYMMIGYFCCKKNLLDIEASDKISWIVVNIANPGLIINAAVNGDGAVAGKELFQITGIATVLFLSLILVGLVVPLIFRISKDKRGIFNSMSTFNNIGFMGFPIISATYGNEALLYASVFVLPFNALIYTYGIYKIGGGKGNNFEFRKIMNVGVVACLISLIICVLQLQVPEFVKTTTAGLSGLTAPLSMMVIGMSLTQMNLKEMFLDIQMIGFSLFKLLVIPVLGMMVVMQFIDNEMLQSVCMIMMATPAASITVMLAQQYGGDVEMASKGVALTTVLSVITIPIVSMIVF
jgi:predicted permease